MSAKTSENRDVGVKWGQDSRVVRVKNKMGLHARPAAMVVRVAHRYPDTEVCVKVQKGGEEEEVNGKSIMGLMMLAANYGTELVLTAKGPNAKELLEEMVTLFEKKFEET